MVCKLHMVKPVILGYNKAVLVTCVCYFMKHVNEMAAFMSENIL